MIMAIENKRRELFEALALTCAWLGLGDAPERDGTGYAECETHTAWIAFNAALDAVVIELPERDTSSAGGPDSEMGPSYEQVDGCGYNYALDDCRAAIESTGLGLKVLP